MRYQANGKVFEGKRELGRVTYSVKANSQREARGKISRLVNSSQPSKARNAQRQQPDEQVMINFYDDSTDESTLDFYDDFRRKLLRWIESINVPESITVVVDNYLEY